MVNGGEPAFAAFLAMRQHPPPSDVPPRDLAEAVNEVIGQFSKVIPGVVLDRFEAGELGAFETYWALGTGSGERSITVLIAGLKSKDKYCR